MASKKKTEVKSEKSTPKVTKSTKQQLQDFMLSKLGGEEAVRKEFAQIQLKDLPSSMTIQEAFDKAAKEGWGDEFNAFPLSVFRLSQVPAKSKTKRKKVPFAQVLIDVTSHMVKDQAYKAPAMAKELGFTAESVRRALALMIKEKKVKKAGEKRASTYSLS